MFVKASVPFDQGVQIYQEVVLPQWIDENGHLSSAHYKSLADGPLLRMMASLGIDEDYFRVEQGTIFQLEMHIVYERELVAGEAVAVRIWMVGADAKRLHLFCEMFRASTGERAATIELMGIHVDRVTRRATPFRGAAAERVAAMAAAHALLDLPGPVGKRISLDHGRR